MQSFFHKNVLAQLHEVHRAFVVTLVVHVRVPVPVRVSVAVYFSIIS